MKCSVCSKEIGSPAYQVAEVTEVHVSVVNVCRDCWCALCPARWRRVIFQSPVYVDRLTGDRFTPQRLPSL